MVPRLAAEWPRKAPAAANRKNRKRRADGRENAGPRQTKPIMSAGTGL